MSEPASPLQSRSTGSGTLERQLSAPLPEPERGESLPESEKGASLPEPEKAAPLAGAIGRNLLLFGRLLRACGIPTGTDRLLTAQQALLLLGWQSREQVHAALRSTLISQARDRDVFDVAFRQFWTDPRWLERMFGQGLEGPSQAAARASDESAPTDPPSDPVDPLTDRVKAALDALMQDGANESAQDLPPDGDPEANALETDDPHAAQKDAAADKDWMRGWSAEEALRNKDFETLEGKELQLVLNRVCELRPALPPVRTRRFKGAVRGRIDLRRSLARWRRSPDAFVLLHRQPRTRPASLVVLLDVSGSMERYSHVLLHWCHALVHWGTNPIEVFSLGTRLQHLTPLLRNADAGRALQRVQASAADWGAGTQLGPCLQAFSRDWARRVLHHRTALMLVTDGLDRSDPGLLSASAQRLSRQAYPFIWLNPLLRFAGFEPRAAGIRALLPHVNQHLPVHNLNSLADLARVFTSPQASVHRSPTSFTDAHLHLPKPSFVH